MKRQIGNALIGALALGAVVGYLVAVAAFVRSVWPTHVKNVRVVSVTPLYGDDTVYTYTPAGAPRTGSTGSAIAGAVVGHLIAGSVGAVVGALRAAEPVQHYDMQATPVRGVLIGCDITVRLPVAHGTTRDVTMHCRRIADGTDRTRLCGLRRGYTLAALTYRNDDDLVRCYVDGVR